MKLDLTLIIFLFLMTLGNTQAQVNSYTTQQLPTPNQLSPFFAGSITESKIYYGDASTANTNKPVVVFVHGFIDLANAWFVPGNDMYDRMHERGYRTAFVAMTRGKGMWYNGEMLSYMIDDITAHYGVNDVVIVAHSNGGKASEVAMFSFGKFNKVNRVLTLGTPFKGTALADLGELPAFGWLMDLIGLGGGTSTSTTYYMETVARPILDNHPNNQPGKFINFGAWGYNKGNTLAAPAMATGGFYLNLNGAGPFNGGNDGVTPYYSSTRPGGAPKWPGHCWGWWCNKVSKHDHIDITYGNVSFNSFEPWISNSLRAGEETTMEEFQRDNILSSNYDIISPKAFGTNSFIVPEGAGRVEVSIMHKKDISLFQLTDAQGNNIPAQSIADRNIGEATTSFYSIDNPNSGKYEISAPTEEYVAFVSYENAPILLFDNTELSYDANAPITLKASIEGSDAAATITGFLTLKNDLDGLASQGETMEIEFKHLGNMVYEYQLPILKEGTYSLLVKGSSADMDRSIVSGFVVQRENQGMLAEGSELLLNNYPNPVRDVTKITLEKEQDGVAQLSLYDQLGRLVKVENLDQLPLGKHQVEWNLDNVAAGSYFLEYSNEGKQTTQKLIIVK